MKITIPTRIRTKEGNIDALAKNIEENELITPIAVTKDNTLIAGYRRLTAWRKLGRKDDDIPKHVLKAKEALELLDLEIIENLHRKAMDKDDVGKGLVFRKKLYEELHPETKRGYAGGKARHQLTANVAVSSFVENTSRKIDIPTRTIYDSIQFHKLPDEFKKYLKESEDLDINDLGETKALRKYRQWKQAEAGKKSILPTTIDLRHGDFREVLKDIKPVDLILTDPPYPKEYLPLWDDLAEFAENNLKEGGILAIIGVTVFFVPTLTPAQTLEEQDWLSCRHDYTAHEYLCYNTTHYCMLIEHENQYAVVRCEKVREWK